MGAYNLRRMPTEIVFKILDCLNDRPEHKCIEDMLAFARTSKKYNNITRQYIENKYTSGVESFSGYTTAWLGMFFYNDLKQLEH